MLGCAQPLSIATEASSAPETGSQLVNVAWFGKQLWCSSVFGIRCLVARRCCASHLHLHRVECWKSYVLHEPASWNKDIGELQAFLR